MTNDSLDKKRLKGFTDITYIKKENGITSNMKKPVKHVENI